MPIYLVPSLVLGVIPLVGFIRIWPIPAGITSGSVIALSFAAFGLLLVRRRKQILYLPRFSVFLLVFGAIVGLSALWNDYEVAGSLFWAILSILSSALFCITQRNIASDTDSSELASKLLFVFALGLSLYCLGSLLAHYLLLASDRPTDFLSRLTGLWGQPNLSATMAWLALFAWFSSSRGRGPGFTGWVGIFAASAVIALAASRTSVLVFMLFIALLYWTSRGDSMGRADRRFKTGLLTVGLLLVMTIALPHINNAFYNLMGLPEPPADGPDSLLQRMGSDQVRIQEHVRLIEGWLDLPAYQQLIGTGNYSLFSLNARMDGFEAVQPAATPMHSHNLYSMILVEQGLLGLGLAVLATIWVAYQLFRIRFEYRFLPLAGAIGAIFIHSNLEYPLWYPWFLHCLALLVLLIGPNDFSVRLHPSRLMQTVGMGLLLVVSLTVWNSANQLKTILGAQLGEANDPEEYVQLRLLNRDTFLGEYASLSRISAYGPDWDRLNSEVREIERLKVTKPLDVVLMRELVLAVKQGRSRDELCVLATDLARTYPFATTILLEKVGLMGPRTISVLTYLPDCMEAGLAAWGFSLEEMAQRNQETRAFYSESRRNDLE